MYTKNKCKMKPRIMQYAFHSIMKWKVKLSFIIQRLEMLTSNVRMRRKINRVTSVIRRAESQAWNP